jgi:hypothetical protein
MWRTVFAALILTISLSSCSGLDLVKGAADMALGGSQPGIEVDANVAKGDAEGDDSVAQNANTAVSLDAGSREVFEGAVGQVVNEAGLPIHVLLLVVLLAGWAIPSPAQCVLGGVRVFREAIDIALGRKL